MFGYKLLYVLYFKTDGIRTNIFPNNAAKLSQTGVGGSENQAVRVM
jgi:hypothetical protein